MKALVGAFNQEKALVWAFSVIVQPVVEPMDRFTALIRNEETGVEVDYKCPVVSVEEMDSSHTPLTEMFDEARCWKVPYYTMKSLFRFYNWNGQYECNKMEWRVSYCTEINITSKIESKRPKIMIRK